MDLLPDLLHEFRRHKDLADRALAALDDSAFFQRPAEAVNPIALIVKHLAGNLTSRWTEFLTSDGDKPGRNRDAEFLLTDQDSRVHLLNAWEHGWHALFETLQGLRESDLEKTITIRGEPHTVYQAAVRGLTHAAYHIGQILYVARLVQPSREWLTIAPGQSQSHQGTYRQGSKPSQ